MRPLVPSGFPGYATPGRLGEFPAVDNVRARSADPSTFDFTHADPFPIFSGGISVMRSPHRKSARAPITSRTQSPRRRIAARAAAVAAVVSTALFPVAAFADAQLDKPKQAISIGFTTDAVDTYGRLDIQRVRDRVVAVDRAHYLISYRVRTYTPFGSARLDGSDRNFDLELDRDGVAGSERTVLLLDDDGRLEAQIISTATREVLATISASRPNDHAIEITGPRRLLGARSYFWASNFHADTSMRCGQQDGVAITCQDSVPDDGWLRLDRPAWPDLENRRQAP
jgi:hypothetical protein